MASPIIERVKVTRFRSPTSGRTWGTRAAAYRHEAKARFKALACDDWCLTGDGPCKYHDDKRWKQTREYSRNGRIVARWASMLAARDGVHLPRPEDHLPRHHHFDHLEPGDIPF